MPYMKEKHLHAASVASYPAAIYYMQAHMHINANQCSQSHTVKLDIFNGTTLHDTWFFALRKNFNMLQFMFTVVPQNDLYYTVRRYIIYIVKKF